VGSNEVQHSLHKDLILILAPWGLVGLRAGPAVVQLVCRATRGPEVNDWETVVVLLGVDLAECIILLCPIIIRVMKVNLGAARVQRAKGREEGKRGGEGKKGVRT